jgi:hypothetical protein
MRFVVGEDSLVDATLTKIKSSPAKKWLAFGNTAQAVWPGRTQGFE